MVQHVNITCFLIQYCILFFGVLQPLQSVSSMGYVTYNYLARLYFLTYFVIILFYSLSLEF